MIAQLVAQYFECHPQVVEEGERGGKSVSWILWINRSLPCLGGWSGDEDKEL